jgi:SAM-dependent methyltransferase
MSAPSSAPTAALPPRDETREVCALCGQLDAVQPFFDAGTRGHVELPWLVRCARCDLAFAHPQPSDDELRAIYDDEYYEQFGFAGRRPPAGLVFTKQATYSSLLEGAEAHLPATARELLDVGCGLGFSLLAASARGWTATGVDPLAPNDPALVPGRTMLRGTLEDAGLRGRFDLVTLVDAIEHVRDPRSTIAAAKNALRPGGLLALATNDVTSLGARALGSRWTHFHRAHLWFFSPATLRRVTEAEGLEVVEVKTASRVYNLEYVASILARGENFPLARGISRTLLRVTPGGLRVLPWPPLPEGFVVFARRPA